MLVVDYFRFVNEIKRLYVWVLNVYVIQISTQIYQYTEIYFIHFIISRHRTWKSSVFEYNSIRHNIIYCLQLISARNCTIKKRSNRYEILLPKRIFFCFFFVLENCAFCLYYSQLLLLLFRKRCCKLIDIEW